VSGPPSRTPGRRDVGVAALAVLLSFLLFSPGGGPAVEDAAARNAAMTGLAFALGVPLAWRRLHPRRVAAAVIVAALGYAITLGPVPPFALWFALFAVVVHVAPSQAAVTAGLLTGLGTVAAVVTGPLVTGRGAGGALPTLLFTLVVGLAAAVVRTERERLEALRQRAVSLERERDAASREAAAEERLKIARDLHDLVGHGLSTLAVQSSTARVLLDSGDVAAARERLSAVEETSRISLREMRQLLDVLRDDDSGLRPSPGFDELESLVRSSRESGLDVTLAVDDVQHVPAAVALASYRIVQESLTNVRKHAAGASVSVRVSAAPDAVDVRVVDTGGRSAGESGDGGRGLLGIRERVAALGGTVTAGPSRGGWQVHARLPVDGGAT
jgi:signal transduction histidine kinase